MIVEKNREQDLFFVTEDNRIIFIPQNWCDEFEADPDDEPSIYGWYGNKDIPNWKNRDSKEWYTFESQAWQSVTYLESLKEVTEEEARSIDPDLFELLDAVNSGVAT